jgi:UDP-N-acetylmuramate dehydrogenase
MGNAGSFFKNPTLPLAQYEQLQNKWPAIPHYPAGSGHVKIPAAWLIEQSGWKGRRMGAVGCHATQPLVLVNYGGATRSELWQHALRVKASVYDQFGVTLEPEVNLYPPAA